MNQALLSFSIGPVQDFIAAARTMRDLWTGSYLLSWLTAHAICAVRRTGGEILFPDIGNARDGTLNPLIVAIDELHDGRRSSAPDAALQPCLPNTFVARVPGGQLDHVAEDCHAAAMGQWLQIAGCSNAPTSSSNHTSSVHTALSAVWKPCGDWDAGWDAQIHDFWDIQIAKLPETADAAQLVRLLHEPRLNAFQLRWQALAKLAAAQKQIRHFPSHELANLSDPHPQHIAGVPRREFDDTRPKCSLLGSFAQMGRIVRGSQSQMSDSREFWKTAQAINLHGTRLGSRDRLSAVGLVKRFAWSAVLAKSLGREPRDRHFGDIDTICCRKWLDQLDSDQRFRELNWEGLHRAQSWSGHWLRWESRDEAEQEGEICPEQATFEKIRRAKSSAFAGPPPTYYAVIALDGDHLGRLLRGLDEPGLRTISRRLTTFAVQSAQEVLCTHLGQLVYAGGDDVLALLPANEALSCARQLNDRYQAALEQVGLPQAPPRTCSAGIVVAHYKTPLRTVLEEVRDAERAAKRAGRDCLAVCIQRRSGERARAVLGWEAAAAGASGSASSPQPTTLDQLRADFDGGTSDRWTYRFRQQLPHLPDDLCDESTLRIWRAELTRLLKHAEGVSDDARGRILDFWDRYRDWVTQRRSADAAVELGTRWPESFLLLVQAASFLARGKEA